MAISKAAVEIVDAHEQARTPTANAAALRGSPAPASVVVMASSLAIPHLERGADSDGDMMNPDIRPPANDPRPQAPAQEERCDLSKLSDEDADARALRALKRARAALGQTGSSSEMVAHESGEHTIAPRPSRRERRSMRRHAPSRL